MSNTEVKLLNAKSSWGIAPCEGRTLPCDYSGIAQLVEHLTVNQGVDGSSPPAGVSFIWRVVRVGRRSIIGNDVNGLKPVSRVRIPYSPYNMI